jgi:hypothetical protein
MITEVAKAVNVAKVPIVKKLINIRNEDTKLMTEDTGKTFEYALCLLFGIPYTDSTFKYCVKEAMTIADKLQSFITDIKYEHTASRGSKYDFTASDLELSAKHKYISLKSNKLQSKVATQVIGQITPKGFCERMDELYGIINPYENDEYLKKYIQDNIKVLLPFLFQNTINFNCDILYYQKKKDTIRYIELLKNIDWEDHSYKWTRPAKKSLPENTGLKIWTNSSSMKIKIEGGSKYVTILEWQFLETRKNMAIRWNLDNLLSVFEQHFKIDFIHRGIKNK